MPQFELEDTGPRVRPYPWEGRDFASINNVMLALVGAGDEEEARLFMAEYRRFCGSAAVAEDNLRTIAAHMSDRYAREKVHLWFIAAPVRPIEYEYQDPPPAPPTQAELSEWGAHGTHCCKRHGCKYGEPDCPVAFGPLPGVRCQECELLPPAPHVRDIRVLNPSPYPSIESGGDHPGTFRCDACGALQWNGTAVCSNCRTPQGRG